MANVTKSAKVIAALESGVELTGKQIESRYNVGNARALICNHQVGSLNLPSGTILER